MNEFVWVGLVGGVSQAPTESKQSPHTHTHKMATTAYEMDELYALFAVRKVLTEMPDEVFQRYIARPESASWVMPFDPDRDAEMISYEDVWPRALLGLGYRPYWEGYASSDAAARPAPVKVFVREPRRVMLAALKEMASELTWRERRVATKVLEQVYDDDDGEAEEEEGHHFIVLRLWTPLIGGWSAPFDEVHTHMLVVAEEARARVAALVQSAAWSAQDVTPDGEVAVGAPVPSVTPASTFAGVYAALPPVTSVFLFPFAPAPAPPSLGFEIARPSDYASHPSLRNAPAPLTDVELSSLQRPQMPFFPTAMGASIALASELSSVALGLDVGVNAYNAFVAAQTWSGVKPDAPEKLMNLRNALTLLLTEADPYRESSRRQVANQIPAEAKEGELHWVAFTIQVPLPAEKSIDVVAKTRYRDKGQIWFTSEEIALFTAQMRILHLEPILPAEDKNWRFLVVDPTDTTVQLTDVQRATAQAFKDYIYDETGLYFDFNLERAAAVQRHAAEAQRLMDIVRSSEKYGTDGLISDSLLAAHDTKRTTTTDYAQTAENAAWAAAKAFGRRFLLWRAEAQTYSEHDKALLQYFESVAREMDRVGPSQATLIRAEITSYAYIKCALRWLMHSWLAATGAGVVGVAMNFDTVRMRAKYLASILPYSMLEVASTVVRVAQGAQQPQQTIADMQRFASERKRSAAAAETPLNFSTTLQTVRDDEGMPVGEKQTTTVSGQLSTGSLAVAEAWKAYILGTRTRTLEERFVGAPIVELDMFRVLNVQRMLTRTGVVVAQTLVHTALYAAEYDTLQLAADASTASSRYRDFWSFAALTVSLALTAVRHDMRKQQTRALAQVPPVRKADAESLFSANYEAIYAMVATQTFWYAASNSSIGLGAFVGMGGVGLAGAGVYAGATLAARAAPAFFNRTVLPNELVQLLGARKRRDVDLPPRRVFPAASVVFASDAEARAATTEAALKASLERFRQALFAMKATVKIDPYEFGEEDITLRNNYDAAFAHVETLLKAVRWSSGAASITAAAETPRIASQAAETRRLLTEWVRAERMNVPEAGPEVYLRRFNVDVDALSPANQNTPRMLTFDPARLLLNDMRAHLLEPELVAGLGTNNYAFPRVNQDTQRALLAAMQYIRDRSQAIAATASAEMQRASSGNDDPRIMFNALMIAEAGAWKLLHVDYPSSVEAKALNQSLRELASLGTRNVEAGTPKKTN